MKNHLFAFCLLAASTLLTSCNGFLYSDDVPPGGYETRSYNFQAFDRIEAGNVFIIHVIPSNEFSVTAKGARQDIDDLIIQNRNGELSVQYRKTGLNIKKIRRHRMEIEIRTNNLKELDLAGASKTDISAQFDLSRLDVDLSGASRLTLNGTVGKLEADISGASEISLLNRVTEIDADISGASSLHAFDADAENAYLDLSGASKAKVTVTKLLDVEASGASTVTYKGNPSVKTRLTGASKVTKD